MNNVGVGIMDKSLKICVCAYRDWQWFNPLIADYTNDKSCMPIMVQFSESKQLYANMGVRCSR